MKSLLLSTVTLSALGLVGAIVWSQLPSTAEEDTPLASPAVLLEDEPGFGNSRDNEDSVPSMTDTPDWGSGDASLEPIDVAEVDEFSVGIYTDVGYRDEEGRYVIDLLEQDYAYLTVIVTDMTGRPVVGAVPQFELTGDSEFLPPEEVSSKSVTGPSGTLDFALIGGPMALDALTVRVGEARAEMLINVISLRASGFPVPPTIEGGIPWTDLMSARIRYPDDTSIEVEFPEKVVARSGDTVKLSGFMMPLDPDLEQQHFLLTSNPPSCFYHVPGGPAGAIEVFAVEGIEASWEPIIVEGRFETLNTNEYGVIYRLHDARVQAP